MQSSWPELLRMAVNEPGVISAAYHAFWPYSAGNQALAAYQCRARGMIPGPISTYRGWQQKGRQVKKGAKAISLWMPVSYTKMEKDKTGQDKPVLHSYFVVKSHWFVITETDGEPYAEPAIPGWDLDKALAAFDYIRIPFELADGNTQGYAVGTAIAISPVARHPEKTCLHEIAHILLDHTIDPNMAPALKEAEAESVAMLVAEALGIEGAAESRGYIQSWFGQGNELPAESAQRIFSAADRIVKAGR